MLIFRSLFVQLLPPYIMGTVILTFILSMDTVYRLINLIVTKGVSVISVGLMLVYRLPQFLAITLPLAMVIAAFVLMVRLSMDLEITAMRASGMSFWYIGKPIFAFGFVTTLATYSLTLFLQPYGYAAFEEEKLKILKSHTAKNIVPGVLNYDFTGQVLYVQNKASGSDDLQGIFFTESEQKPESMVMMANKGRVQIREEQSDIVLKLIDGTAHVNGETPEEYQTIQFNSLDYIFKLPGIGDSQKGTHIWGTPTSELSALNTAKAYQELMLRLTTPWACLGFAFGAISMGVTDPRRGRSGAYLRALTLVVGYYILWLAAKEMSIKSVSQAQALWLPPIAILVFGIYNLYKLDNNLDNFFQVMRMLLGRSPKMPKQLH